MLQSMVFDHHQYEWMNNSLALSLLFSQQVVKDDL